MGYDHVQNVFKVTGVFCSWGCVKSFNRDCRPVASQSVDAMIIGLFYKRCTGRIDPIKSAPPKFVLEAFGGHLKIDEYRDLTRQGVSYDILPPKMVLRSQVLHEHRLQDAREREKAATQNDLSTIVNLSSRDESSTELKLRRPKQVNPRKQSLFEKIVMATGGQQQQTPGST